MACQRCHFINAIIPRSEETPMPPELLKEIRLSSEERQIAYPEFVRDEQCREGIKHLGEKDRADLIQFVMNGREGMSKQALARVRIFRHHGQRDYYWHRAAEFTAKARIRDFLEKVWNLI